MIRFKCPKCSKDMTAADEHAGKKARCPACQQIMAIPGARAAPAPAPPPAAAPASRPPSPPPPPPPAIRQPAPPPARAARPAPVREEEVPEVEEAEEEVPEVAAVDEESHVAETPSRRRRPPVEEEEEDYEEERPRRGRRGRSLERRGPFADCPNCGAPGDATRIWYTLWGGFVGPLIINHVRCNRCGTAYNGKSGDDNTTRIVIFIVVSIVIGLVLGTFAAIAGSH